MATAPYQAQAELLQVLRQRDAELARLREERQHKETTIDFLKTKIVTLQNQNRAALSERPAPAVEDLQRRLDAAVQAKDKALHRQEELSVQLQDLQMEVGDLRQELTQARAEVARLATELEKAQHRENGIDAPTSTSVLLAVEELERELAQDVNHLEPREVNHSDAPVTMTTMAGSEDVPEASQVAASPKLQEVATSPKLQPRETKVATSPKLEPREAKATSPKLEPREAKVATSSASPKLEPRSEAASPKLEPREAKVSLPDPDEEVKALLLSACLFSTITSFQVWAAYLAKSRALLMDCISSAVDALTFIGNVAVECRKRDGRRHPCSQLMVVATSLGLLTFFTIRALGESYGKVLVCQEHGRNSEGDDDDVNGWITLGFALGNMLFDIICLVNFLKSHKQTGSGKHANMFSAFLHVGADFLRAFTALVLSLLILICTSWDSTCLDAYCSLVIGVTILCGVLVGLQKWICLLLSLLFADE